MKILVYAACLVCAAWLTNARSETFKVGFYNYPPMMIESGRTGIYQELLDELGQITGHRFQAEYLPYARLAKRFDLGQIDLELGVFPGWVKQERIPGVFSIPFGKVIDVLVFAPGKHFKVSTPRDLSGKTVGLVRGYSYPELRELFASGVVHRADAVNEQQLMAMLAAGRMDQILINKAVAQYSVLQVPNYSELVIGDVLGSYDVSIRVQPSKKALLPKLDEAILIMKRSGAIARIYGKYGVSP
ncbi:transporter substrate-binding domain-containing protein [Massilia sp. CCM 8695]|uniref:Transporter substrate-binding domain-containing protein n=1 Tax=Massilia frigida TaxID=2609281 RepID=A0ABX0N8Z8_9BURK|nr:transporter substrate-binding domain-containing protein [Massilia frigida]NHZ78503.1 transporter substrate-binding domain-containing protein [Massilia frigida]